MIDFSFLGGTEYRRGVLGELANLLGERIGSNNPSPIASQVESYIVANHEYYEWYNSDDGRQWNTDLENALKLRREYIGEQRKRLENEAVAPIKAKYQAISNDLSLRIAAVKKKKDTLTMEQSSLGIFAFRRKKEVRSELENCIAQIDLLVKELRDNERKCESETIQAKKNIEISKSIKEQAEEKYPFPDEAYKLPKKPGILRGFTLREPTSRRCIAGASALRQAMEPYVMYTMPQLQEVVNSLGIFDGSIKYGLTYLYLEGEIERYCVNGEMRYSLLM